MNNNLPSTPAPRRFLLAKRSSQATSSQAPGSGPPLPRFQSTPRFGSSSIPRPTQRRELDIEDEEDEDDDRVSDSASSIGHDDSDGYGDERVGNTGSRKTAGLVDDVVEMESDDWASSQADGAWKAHESRLAGREQIEIDSPDDSLGEGDSSSPWGREAKRRKMSISPAPESSPFQAERDTGDVEDEPVFEPRGQEIPDSESDWDATESQRSTNKHEYENSEDEDQGDAMDTRLAQQPIFHPAPRFKPAEVEDTFEGLPAVFSPQKKGAKYLPGGLAAGLQGLLSEVKGWDDDADRTVGKTMKLHVEEARPGRRMYLVKAHMGAGAGSKRFMLAGEGKLTGLARRTEVKMGSVVIVGPPVWGVELDGVVWTVACDWSVESS